MHAFVIAFVAMTACKEKKSAPAEPDAASSAPEATPTASVAVVDEDAAASIPRSRREAPAVEARRSRLARLADEPALARSAEALAKALGGTPPAMRVQRAELTSGARSAWLVEPDPPDRRAFVLVATGDGERAWTKERPAGGILAPIGAMAIAPGPRGRVMLAVCDPPTRSVAAREWDEDGTAFADFQALAVEACDDVSVFYWRRHGWILVATGPRGSRAQLLTEGGGLAWGEGGLAVGGAWRAPAPASLAADSDTSVVLVQMASVAGADHALAYRYDERGGALWPTPVDLGTTKPPRDARLPLERPRPGVVRVALADRAVEITSSGDVRRAR